ncbi:MAG TPA: DUF362 domain-containing protein [Spirochaetota bacterium]|nr:DUF362 domain-containing protein [Spirochaetota bacterium]HRX46107.1 DUF362 domain-containing protein [Spirochaetota bacterium]
MLTRKRFLKAINEILSLSFLSFLIPSFFTKHLIAESSGKSGFDLIALRGGKSPADLFNKGINQMGGMQRFVKKGGTVLVKPNIGWDRSPEYGANTNPDLVEAVIKECYKAGASKVYLFDHTCDQWQNCYKKSGIQNAAAKTGAELVPASSKEYYIQTSLPKGRVLKETLVHKLFIQCDTVINIPVLKHHSSTGLTASMKNLMGVVWDRGEWHRRDLHQCIADFSTFRKPDLVIIDGWRVMTRNGPRGYGITDTQNMKYLFFSTDPVAADSASAMVLAKTSGLKSPADIRYIKLAGEMGLGNNDLSKITIKRIQV